MAAGWAASNNLKVIRSRALKEKDMLTGSLVSQKSGMDLMQNCDLPPPLKVFSGSDKTVLSSMSRVFGMMGGDDETGKIDIYEGGGGGGGGEKEKLELLQALRLSQTRAREAERKALNLAKERDRLSNALLRGSAELSVYRHCVRLLEFQVSKLRLQWQQKGKGSCCCSRGRSKGPKEFSEERKDRQDGDGDGELPWLLASLALCLGIAGVGLALGYRYWC